MLLRNKTYRMSHLVFAFLILLTNFFSLLYTGFIVSICTSLSFAIVPGTW